MTLLNPGTFDFFVDDASKSEFPGLPAATITATNFLPSMNQVPVTSARCKMAPMFSPGKREKYSRIRTEPPDWSETVQLCSSPDLLTPEIAPAKPLSHA